MRFALLLGCLSGCCFLSETSAQSILGWDDDQIGEPLPLYYDSETGNATIDFTRVRNGETAGYSFAVDGLLPCSAFRPENHTPFMGSFASARADGLGESNFNNFSGGVYSLGNIMPVDLTEEELVGTYFVPMVTSIDLNKYFVLGPFGSNSVHLLQPVYSPSPFPALNDPLVGPAAIVTQWATSAQLTYDAVSGEVTLDTVGAEGGAMFSYEISLTEPLFSPGNFVPIRPERQDRSTIRSDRILEVDWNGIPAGDHSLGTILPSGLSIDELSDIIASAQFLGEPGHSVSSFSIEDSGIEMSIHRVVPEPSGCGMLAIGLLLFAKRRGTN